MYPPETQQRIQDLRAKSAAGALTRADCIEAVRLLREGREAAAAGAAKKGKKSAAPVDVAKLFSDLDKIG